MALNSLLAQSLLRIAYQSTQQSAWKIYGLTSLMEMNASVPNYTPWQYPTQKTYILMEQRNTAGECKCGHPVLSMESTEVGSATATWAMNC